MNFKKILKDTEISLEIIYFLLLIIIIYYLYSILNNINKEYFSVGAINRQLPLQILRTINNNKCNNLISIIQTEGNIEKMETLDIYYIVNRCENFNQLETEIQNNLINIANEVNSKETLRGLI